MAEKFCPSTAFHLKAPPKLCRQFSCAYDLICSKLKESSFRLLEQANETSLPLKLELKSNLLTQQFFLNISTEGIAIQAGDNAGLFYGLIEFYELTLKHNKRLPFLQKTEQPKIKHRGYMLDISRCKVPKLSEIKKLIDQLAFLKYNHLQLYIEHTFAFKGHEQVWGDSSALTSDEIRELDQYCSDRFIELVPNLNSFGHFERWLKHKEYQHLAEAPNGFTSPFGDFRQVGSVLKPNQQSLKFINSLYNEYLPNFKSKLFNVGCDETFELGQGYSKKKVEKTDVHRVYFEHLLKIQKLVKKHKRNMMFWGDILIESPEVISELPSSITALLWGYEADHPFEQQCKILKSTKADYWVCPGTSSWNSLIGRWDNAKANILNAYHAGIKHRATGVLLTDWGDGGHHQTSPISWPGIAFNAQLCWNGIELNDRELATKIDDTFVENETKLGATLLKLGKLHKKLNRPILNGNALHHYLFDTNKVKPLSKSKAQQFKKELKAFKEKLTSNDLETKEIRLNLEMAEVALEKSTKSEVDKNIAVKLIGDYEKVWTARNRIGGLHESSSKLRAALNLS